MSQQVRFLNEAQCAALAGVSLETLREYERLGILQPLRKDGEFWYAEPEVRNTFQVSNDENVGDTKQSSEELTQSKQELSQEAPALQAVSEPAAMPRTESVTSGPVESSSSNSAASQTSNSSIHRTVEMYSPGEGNSFDLLDLNRSLRDQIQMLKEERDWLRKRVENLEGRSERDQMLLISESQNVKSLLPKKGGFWMFALPWLRNTNSSEKQ